MSSDASLILHPVRLLLEGAPATDAADTVVEKWGKYVVQLLVRQFVLNVSVAF